VCAEGRNPAEMTAGELANGAPRCADADAEQVVRTMRNHRIRSVPVLENQRMVGMISEADLARHLSDEQIARFVTGVYATT
jgi:CBS domain-containing protein